MAKSQICHEGVVVEVQRDCLIVEMTARSACSSCHAKGVCSVGDEAMKTIAVPAPPFQLFVPGDKVEVMLNRSMGLKAVWISYVIPLAVLMILILSLSAAGLKELIVGLVSILAVALYYLAIYLLRERISDKFYFSVRKIEQQH